MGPPALPALVLDDWTRRSVEDFYQINCKPGERENIGLESVFRSIFPIWALKQNRRIEYQHYLIGNWTCDCGNLFQYNWDDVKCEKCYGKVSLDIDPDEFLIRNQRTRKVPIILVLKLCLDDIEHSVVENVHLGEFPILSEDTSTFLLSGMRRVLLTQIRRTSKVLFLDDVMEDRRQARIYVEQGCNIKVDSDGFWLGVSKTPVSLETMESIMDHNNPHSRIDDFIRVYENLQGVCPESDDVGISWVQTITQFRISKVARKNFDDTVRAFLKWMGEDTSGWDKKELLQLDLEDLGVIQRMLFERRRGSKRFPLKLEDIDDLSNKSIQTPGDILTQTYTRFLTATVKGLKLKLSLQKVGKRTKIRSLGNWDVPTKRLNTFLRSTDISQLLDSTNKLSEITHVRRLTMKGSGGVSSDIAGDTGFSVRDIKSSYFGSLCPLETPEGRDGLGLVVSPSIYSSVNDNQLQTPYLDMKTGRARMMSFREAEGKYISTEDAMGSNDIVESFNDGNFQMVNRTKVDLIHRDRSQMFGLSAAQIPYIFHNDVVRAVTGCNMQRQAVPLVTPEAPLVHTGCGRIAAQASGATIRARAPGRVICCDGSSVLVDEGSRCKMYSLPEFRRSDAGTVNRFFPEVEVGQDVSEGDIIASSSNASEGELALGKNVLCAYMCWHGHTFEDSVVVSEEVVRSGKFLSLHIHKHVVSISNTRMGPETVDETLRESLPHIVDGVVCTGMKVKPGDVLVTKMRPKQKRETYDLDDITKIIVEGKEKEYVDCFAKCDQKRGGIVIAVDRIGWSSEASITDSHEDVFLNRNLESIRARILEDAGGLDEENWEDLKESISVLWENSRKGGWWLPELEEDVKERIVIYTMQLRNLEAGDKLANRHGNKGVISKIVPVEDMPFMEDGTPLEVLFSPLGVPSRMNLGQVLEVHAGLHARKHGLRVNSFETHPDDLDVEDGKKILRDGLTGEKFDNPVTVGVQYVLKLNHMVEDKLKARATDSYSLISQQPSNYYGVGGQRMGEMEMWALYAYGAAHTIKEMITTKSDSIEGRNSAYANIVEGRAVNYGNRLETVRLLKHTLAGLGLNLEFFDTAAKIPKAIDYDKN